MTDRRFTIGELAVLTGLTRRALRIYEEAGLLVPQRSDNGYRCYTEQHLKDTRVIHDMRQAGIPLVMIGQLITIKHSGLSADQKLIGCLDVLDEIHADLLAKRQAIDAALRQVESHQQEARAMLTEKRSF